VVRDFLKSEGFPAIRQRRTGAHAAFTEDYKSALQERLQAEIAASRRRRLAYERYLEALSALLVELKVHGISQVPVADRWAIVAYVRAIRNAARNPCCAACGPVAAARSGSCSPDRRSRSGWRCRRG
jgi:hypothetical protein